VLGVDSMLAVEIINLDDGGHSQIIHTIGNTLYVSGDKVRDQVGSNLDGINIDFSDNPQPRPANSQDIADIPQDIKQSLFAELNEGVRVNPMGDEEEVPARGPEAEDDDDETLSELNEHIINIINSEGVDMGSVGNSRSRGISAEQLPHTANRGRPNRRLNVPVLTRGTEQGIDATDGYAGNMDSVRSKGPEEQRAEADLDGGSRVEPRKNNYKDNEAQRSGLDHGVSVDESFTGTGAIAMAPVAYEVYGDDDDDDDDDENNDNDSKTENIMSHNRSIQEDGLSSDTPSGNSKMDHLGGQGVAKRSAKQDSVGKYNTNLKGHGSYPRKHAESSAMCDVDENGVENEPQGVHDSSAGKPEDGHQTAVGHDWPDAPKNSGGAEAFGNKVSGGGQVSSENKWSPEFVGSLMEGDINFQSLFDAYAREHQLVCLRDFQTLCKVNGSAATFDNRSLENLMAENKEFIFYQGEDSAGLYWTPTPFAGKPLNENDCNCEDCDCDPCECDPVSEAQIRSGSEESDYWGGKGEMAGALGAGDPHTDSDEFPDEDYGEMLNMKIAMDTQQGPGPNSDFGSNITCPECGNVNHADDDACLNCNESLGGGSEENTYGTVDDEDADDRIDFEERYGVGDSMGDSMEESIYKAAANILNENDAVGSPEGKSIAGSASKLKTSPSTDMEELKSLEKSLKGEPTNKSGVTPVVSNTGVMEAVQNNISKLAVHAKYSILEAAKKLRGKYDLTFAIVLKENASLSSRSPQRKQLSEALADAEEALQFSNINNVNLETSFCDASGCTILHNVSMIQIDQRGPMMSEGRVIFRCQSNAERFAHELVAEGKTCKVVGHKRGRASVVTNAPYGVTKKCFLSIKE
tara:strand:+ start:1189 stop:3774 length:2586 start_codon:yes stop_codon:yes gene_type:complete